MQSAISKFAGMACVMFWALFSSTLATANTITYNALTDFPIIDAGEVPYYRDEARQALAINAAQVQFRDRFARAEVVYDGQPGVYQITLVALAEVDGEAEYHLLVNGEIVGVANNPEVGEEFAIVRHEFPDIDLPAGAIIGVESLANSNGRIPENGEYAFARGRWSALELFDADASVGSENIDLELSASLSRQAVRVGETFDISVSVANGFGSAVATGVEVSLQLPVSSLEIVDGSVCSGSPAGIQCSLPELAATESTQLMVTLRAAAAFSAEPINLSVAADQVDSNQLDNATELLLTASADEDSSRTETETETDVPDTGDESVSGLNESEQLALTPSSSRSGGAFSFAFLFGCLMCRAYRRKGV